MWNDTEGMKWKGMGSHYSIPPYAELFGLVWNDTSPLLWNPMLYENIPIIKSNLIPIREG